LQVVTVCRNHDEREQDVDLGLPADAGRAKQQLAVADRVGLKLENATGLEELLAGREVVVHVEPMVVLVQP
jgi:hypothetical protein